MPEIEKEKIKTFTKKEMEWGIKQILKIQGMQNDLLGDLIKILNKKLNKKWWQFWK